MKRFLAIVLLGLSSFVSAQTVETTPNLITSGPGHSWTGVTTGSFPAGYMPGGPQPLYDPATNTISFSYGSASVGQTYAVNQALANVGAGVKINGYNYSYEVRNMNGDDRQPGIDTFTVSQLLRGPQNSVLLSSNQFYNTKFDWKTVTGARVAANPYNIADTTYIQFGVQGADGGFWAGYFGPQIRNVSMSLNYSIDPCVGNPAYSPTCANYNTVSISENLLSGVTGPQAYAINSALAAAGSGATIHGFNYGYNYNVAGRDCAIWSFLGVCLSGWNYSDAGVATVITGSNDATIFSESNTHNGGDHGTSGTYSKQFRLGSSLPITTLGGFAMSPWTSGNASITNMYSQAVYTVDPCVTNPLSSTTCSGYAAAYLTQQCAINALYDSSCPGYAQAVFTQQCNVNQLSDPACPGYAVAYLNYQCSVNSLYSTTCSGYSAAMAQCNVDPLSNSMCPAYQTATTQCSANPLYGSYCPGYTTATTQCSANPLYASYCPGYQFAYACSQDGLYSNQCPDYAEAYAKKNILNIGSTTTGTPTTPSTIVLAQSSDPVAQAAPVVSDPVVNSIVTTKSTAATAETNPAAAVKLTSPAATTTTTAATQDTAKDNKKTDSTTTATATKDGIKPDRPVTTREAVAEQRREAARREAVQKGKDLANEMGRAADMQAQMEVQNVVIQAMGYSPGFDNYGRFILPDGNGYKPFTIYNNQRTVDTPAGRGLFGGSDSVHQRMVDSQYNLGK
jgi:hypothetical protein